MILNLHEGIFPMYLQVSKDSERNKMINDIFQDNNEIIFLSSGELLFFTNILYIEDVIYKFDYFQGKDVLKRQ